MPLVDPADGTVLDILNRLIDLLTADAQTVNLFTFPIRIMPIDNILIGDDVTVAIFSPDFNLMPQTLSTLKVSPRVIMAVTAVEAKTLSAGDVADLYTRIMAISTVLYTLVWKYRRDPTAGDCKWYSLRFLQQPATGDFMRRPQEFQQVRFQFVINTETANP